MQCCLANCTTQATRLINNTHAFCPAHYYDLFVGVPREDGLVWECHDISSD